MTMQMIRTTKQHAELADARKDFIQLARYAMLAKGKTLDARAHAEAEGASSCVQRILTKAEPGLVSAPGGSPETWGSALSDYARPKPRSWPRCATSGLTTACRRTGDAGRHLAKHCGAAPRIDRGGKMTTSGQCCAIALMAARSWVSPPGLPSRTPFPLRRAVPPPTQAQSIEVPGSDPRLLAAKAAW